LDEVLFTVERALTQRALAAQVHALQSDVLDRDVSPEEGALVGEHPTMLHVFKLIGRVANTDEAVLILGESGTGKELVSAAIHDNSVRSAQPFVKINCAALSSTLLESELFGHERGAFTGAVARRAGRFEQASRGTLFLDEIGDLDIGLQAKLLRVLQTGQFERVGGNETLQCDVRVIAATHRDLRRMIDEGQFREDLYYRLNVVTIDLPPLRARREDIPLLADYFVRQLGRKYDWPHLVLAPQSVQWFVEQSWPGNVRQMQNVLARAATLAGGRAVLLEHLQPANDRFQPAEPDEEVETDCTLREILSATERRVIARALHQTGWNRTRAAQQLGISRRQLFDKIRQYGLEQA
jgi:DNA-binding NtrC family response regulator